MQRLSVSPHFSTPSHTSAPQISSGPRQMPVTNLKMRHTSLSSSRTAYPQQLFEFVGQL